jgi:hypothetical protein
MLENMESCQGRDRRNICFATPHPHGIFLNGSSITMSYFMLNSFKADGYSNVSYIQSELFDTLLKIPISSRSQFLGYLPLHSRAMTLFGLMIIDVSLYLTIWYISYHRAVF